MAGDARTEDRFDELTGRVNDLSEEMAKLGPALESVAEQAKGLRSELREETKMRSEDFGKLREELQTGVQGLRSEFREDMTGLRQELSGFRSDFSSFQRQALGLAVTLIGVLIGSVITLVIALH